MVHRVLSQHKSGCVRCLQCPRAPQIQDAQATTEMPTSDQLFQAEDSRLRGFNEQSRATVCVLRHRAQLAHIFGHPFHRPGPPNVPRQIVKRCLSTATTMHRGAMSKRSVFHHDRDQQPNMFNTGCICHLADLCVKAGVKQLSMAVDDLFIDVYFHFQNRSIYAVFLLYCSLTAM